MAKRGPRPKPTEQKVREGNPGKRKLPDDEPKPTNAIPSPPDILDDEAERLWRELSPELERLGLLTGNDAYTFASMCQAWSDYVRHTRYLRENGETYQATNKGGGMYTAKRPEVGMRKEALEQYTRLMKEFGLSPASRVGLTPGGATDDDDGFEEWQRGKT